MSGSADVVVLGGGPAGLMAALRVAREGKSVTVLEQASAVGGMAGSFDVAGIRVDFGSHRLHPVVAPRLLAELQGLLGDDLQLRQRRGRINLDGRWLGFPLQLGDLARNLPKPFLARVAFDTLSGPLRRPKGDTAGDVIAARLGPTVARHFYVPYLTKLWDASPDELSVELADRRVSARSGTAIIRKALRTRKPGGGQFLYPRRGFGQFSEAVADAAVATGADIRLDTPVTAATSGPDGVEVTTAGGDTITGGSLLSTIPIPLLARMRDAPAEVAEAAGRLRHRAMVLAYLVFDIDQLTAFDAHYFPELNTPVSRMSEPKNFRAQNEAPGATVLCAELPCWVGDETWEASAEELAARVMETLTPLGFDFPELAGAEVRRIPRCYPVYTGTYAEDLATLEAWADTDPRLLTFGRQGLFAPDNTHHALHMGWEAADALRPDGTVDRARWNDARASFRSHVVED
jgi:protoporphyrinogen oxidase